MLDQIQTITSSEGYLKGGGIKILEVLFTPWENTELKIRLEIFIEFDYGERTETQTWEISCKGTWGSKGIEHPKIPHTQIKLLKDHPVLWDDDDSSYYSVKGTCENIPEFMGDLYIAHKSICGDWIDFHRLYSSLPETLKTQRENQLKIPNRLQKSCFEVFDKHGIKYEINEVEKKRIDYYVLFFSTPDIWPDDQNFMQAYVIAEYFEEVRIT
ncbi:hypothetical protein [Ferruginibacter sp.]|nr:hypothetical protein [Ferruginibacter sp.]